MPPPSACHGPVLLQIFCSVSHERRSNKTRESKTDPDARLYRKGHGQEARLGYLGQVRMENRNGLMVDTLVAHAHGAAERDAALLMLHNQSRHRRWRGDCGPMSVGADTANDTRDLVVTLREIDVRPHVAQNANRSGKSAIDRRTSRRDR